MSKIFLIFVILLLTACQQPKIDNQKIDAKVVLQQKVSKAFERSEELREIHSRWYDREEKLPLTIIATAYINPNAKNTKEYKAYKRLIQRIEKDPSILGEEISSKYSSIKFIDYNKDPKAQQKFNVANRLRYDDKTILTDALRPNKEEPSQELLIRLNYKELEKGNLTIEGYKTVKQKNKERNSYYYTLRKTDYKNLTKQEKIEAIINSIKTTLQLSIPEYVSIDRSKLIKDGEVLRFITPQADGTYKGEVWKYEIEDEAKGIDEKIDNIYSSTIKVLKVLQGHTNRITSVAISSDGKYALSGSDDDTLIYWNLETKEVIYRLEGHIVDVTSVAISPDGKYALSGSDFYRLKYWDLETGKLLKTLKGHTKSITSVTFSPDGKYALSGSDDDTLKYWDLKTGKIIRTLEGHIVDVTSVAISPDGKYALSGSDDKTLKYWDLNTGKLSKTLRGRINFIYMSS